MKHTRLIVCCYSLWPGQYLPLKQHCQKRSNDYYYISTCEKSLGRIDCRISHNTKMTARTPTKCKYLFLFNFLYSCRAESCPPAFPSAPWFKLPTQFRRRFSVVNSFSFHGFCLPCCLLFQISNVYSFIFELQLKLWCCKSQMSYHLLSRDTFFLIVPRLGIRIPTKTYLHFLTIPGPAYMAINTGRVLHLIIFGGCCTSSLGPIASCSFWENHDF